MLYVSAVPRDSSIGELTRGRKQIAALNSLRFVCCTCYRYIKLNPVRAGVVADPREYRWSSVHHNVGGRADPRLRPHATYLQLGTTDEARRAAYRQLIEGGLTHGGDDALALHTRHQKP